MGKVYVLGAGISKAINPCAPLNWELLPQALLAFPRDSRIIKLRDFISDFYREGKPIDNVANLPPIEDIFTQLDFALAEKRPFSAKYDLTAIQELRDALVYAICKILERALHSSHPGSRPITLDFARQFTHNDTVISLNYDLIIDNGILRNDHTVDYGIPIRDEKRGLYSVRLLKLHGSLNWLYCPTCHALDVKDMMKKVLYVFTHPHLKCPVCNGRYEPILITPTFLKSYGNEFISPIWKHAENALIQAHHIVFIGYSLSDSDNVIRNLISRSLYINREMNGHHPVIEVIERDPNGIDDCPGGIAIPDAEKYQDKTHERYSRLFGKDNVEYRPIGFQAYMDEINARYR